MSTYLDAESELRESGCTDEDIAIMKQLFGDESFKKVEPLKSNESDAYGKIVKSKRAPNITFKEHDPNVDTLYVDLGEVQYFGDLPHYCNFIKSQIAISIKRERPLVIRCTEETADVLTRADPKIFQDATVDFS